MADKNSENSGADGAPHIDVRTWEPYSVRWAELPRNIVAAYFKHQFQWTLGNNPPGASFLEMYENSSPAGRRKIGELVGIRRPGRRKEKYNITDEQREAITKDVLAHCAVKDLFAQFAILEVPGTDVASVMRRLDKELAQKLCDLLVHDAGPASHLATFVERGEQQKRLEIFFTALDHKPEDAQALKGIALTALRKNMEKESYDTWLAKYALANKLDVGALEEEDDWAPTFRDVMEALKETPIRDHRPHAVGDQWA